ncbi:MAG TPA: hypothetical protein VHG08_00665 [Longimicrobium sp.]|nr:hypothetical protein [Longimicrobium sp.]
MKKRYTRPSLAVHGRAVEETRGWPGGEFYDFFDGGYRRRAWT